MTLLNDLILKWNGKPDATKILGSDNWHLHTLNCFQNAQLKRALEIENCTAIV